MGKDGGLHRGAQARTANHRGAAGRRGKARAQAIGPGLGDFQLLAAASLLLGVVSRWIQSYKCSAHSLQTKQNKRQITKQVLEAAPILGDIRDVRPSDIPEQPKAIIAGFPCTDVSARSLDGLC